MRNCPGCESDNAPHLTSCNKPVGNTKAVFDSSSVQQSAAPPPSSSGERAECHPMCGSPYLGHVHHPDCERGAWEAEHTCAQCRKPIQDDIYLCMECTHPFHRACLFRHCGKDQMTNEAYLDAIKSAPYPPSVSTEPHPEDFCQECGRPNAKPWFTPSDVWNRVMRNGGPEPIICPICFIARADKAGIICTGWELRPENYEQETSNQSPASAARESQNAESASNTQSQQTAPERTEDPSQTLTARPSGDGGQPVEGMAAQACNHSKLFVCSLCSDTPPSSTLGFVALDKAQEGPELQQLAERIMLYIKRVYSFSRKPEEVTSEVLAILAAHPPAARKDSGEGEEK